MKPEAIKLRFTTPIHLGKGSEELDKTEIIYHSDSLKSALYSVGLPFFKEWKDEYIFFNSFKISSCFPFAEEEYFLPKPNINRSINFIGFNGDHTDKLSKKIGFLSKNIFELFLNSNNIVDVELNNLSPNKLFVCENSETARKNFFKSEMQQRVKVGRKGETENNPTFYIDRLYFEEDCGLFFLAEFENEIIKKQIYTALKLLGEYGIGTDRTVGNGLFKFNEKRDVDTEFLFKITNNSGKYLSLGLFLPKEEEINHINMDNSNWSFIKRGGYIGGGENQERTYLRRRSIYMFGEGSAFESTGDLKGKYIDLKPDWEPPLHPVWRCGMPLIIKL